MTLGRTRPIERVEGWFWSLVQLAGRNRLTMAGAAVTTTSAVLLLVFLALGLTGLLDTPYAGILTFMVLPGLFMGGLILIPLGLARDRRRRARGEAAGPGESAAYPVLDFRQPRLRRTVEVVALLTLVNVFLVALVSYRGMHFMDSPVFCGKVCHTVMEPEFATYERSPHSRVACVECHIGPGAPWFVRSKLSGAGQVLAVTFGTYETPIPTPVENLRPSRDTCEECHWPQKFTGDRIKVRTRFDEDEANTPLTTVLRMHVGGGDSSTPGIHGWHIDPARETRYVATDRERQVIPWVELREADGTVTVFRAEGDTTGEAALAAAGRRTMDCIDCHNRPTHIFRPPDLSVDEAMHAGRIQRSLPGVKRVAVAALEAARAEASDPPAAIERAITGYYGERYPELADAEKAAIEAAVAETQAIYRRSVFPRMETDWTTHVDNLGHERHPGCFRCHDDLHRSEDGRVIRQDCDLCHAVVAYDEKDPEVLDQLGY